MRSSPVSNGRHARSRTRPVSRRRPRSTSSGTGWSRSWTGSPRRHTVRTSFSRAASSSRSTACAALTKDIDAEAVSAAVTAEHIEQVVRDIAAVSADDGVAFDLHTMSVQVIRDHAEYPGFRMRIKARIGPQQVTVAWDISTGDPVIALPRKVTMPRLPLLHTHPSGHGRCIEALRTRASDAKIHFHVEGGPGFSRFGRG